MEGKDDKQWAQTTCFYFLFHLLFVLLSHRYSCHHQHERHHAMMEGKDNEQWAQTTQRMMGYVFLLFFLPSWLFHGMESIGGCWLGCTVETLITHTFRWTAQGM